MVMVRSNRPL